MASTSSTQPIASAKRALIIDDHAFVRFSLRHILESLGFESIDEAGDGDEALAHAGDLSNPFDLIFCDLQMPGRDGIETLRGLAELRIQALIVLMSGEDTSILHSSVMLARSMPLNLLGHIAKPVSAKEVERLLSADRRAAQPKPVAGAEPVITEGDLQRGLAADEFFVLYQPKVQIGTRELHGTEALVRWRHPRHGLVSPVSFIGIAEQSTAIDSVTELVLTRAIEAQLEWSRQGRQIHVAVNLSTRSMVRLDLPDRLRALVDRLGGNPATIMFEVTESRLVDDLPTFLDIATRLRLKGFRLSIDDFGTGFSTLEQLSRLPLSELKVDRAFVSGAPEDARTRAILEGSLDIARKLQLTTVCEGTENRAEWDLVATLGADCAQGYYITRPIPADQLLPWHRGWRP